MVLLTVMGNPPSVATNERDQHAVLAEENMEDIPAFISEAEHMRTEVTDLGPQPLITKNVNALHVALGAKDHPVAGEIDRPNIRRQANVPVVALGRHVVLLLSVAPHLNPSFIKRWHVDTILVHWNPTSIDHKVENHW